MRINVPNLLYPLAHPLRAANYVVHRDRIPYNAIAKYLPADPVIVEAGAHEGSTTLEMASSGPSQLFMRLSLCRRLQLRCEGRWRCSANVSGAINLRLGDADSFMDMHVSREWVGRSLSVVIASRPVECTDAGVPSYTVRYKGKSSREIARLVGRGERAGLSRFHAA